MGSVNKMLFVASVAACANSYFFQISQSPSMINGAVLGFVYCLGALLISSFLSPQLGLWSELSVADRPQWHSTIGGFVHSLVLCYFAVTSFMDMQRQGVELDCNASVNLGNAPSSESVKFAVGMTISYFVVDFAELVYNSDILIDAMKTEFYVMCLHHIFSIMIWPWALVTNLNAWWISYFIFTEVTNIGLNARWLCLKGKLISSSALLNLSMAWAVSFFVVRYEQVTSICESVRLFLFYTGKLHSR